MECGFDFAGHLHNGDPLTDRTTHVPANRPINGTPLFSWQESAVDALTLEGFKQETDWLLHECCREMKPLQKLADRARGSADNASGDVIRRGRYGEL